jgi:hypothetical protein
MSKCSFQSMVVYLDLSELFVYVAIVLVAFDLRNCNKGCTCFLNPLAIKFSPK